jgi:antitoxin ParD1/3/4
MSEGINVRITGKLRTFVESQIGESGVYESVSEYIRSLIRQDFEKTEAERWNLLHAELLPGMTAGPEEFVDFSTADIKAAARRKKKRNAL